MAKKTIYIWSKVYIYRFEHIFNSKTCIKDKQSSLKHQSLLLPHYIPIVYPYITCITLDTVFLLRFKFVGV